ncbi:MAG: porin [Proteobacteria bacterium]|nr:porin [Pseudomonadota bacterium]
MKKSLIALAVLAASGAAMAQSSVTLFGIVDANFGYVNHANPAGDAKYGLGTSGNATSRLGFRGVEDLGGGLKAGFWLEGELFNDSGNPSGFDFKRASTVSLSGNFGEVRLGRELTPSWRKVASYDPFGQTGIGMFKGWTNWAGATTADADGYRSSNMISYYSPNISGFTAGAGYGFDEQTTGKNGRYFGGFGAYDNGPLSVALSAERRNVVGGALVGAATKDTYTLGGSYDLSVVKLGAILQQVKYKDAVGSAKFNSYALNATAPVGAGEVKAQYSHYDEKGISSKADQFAVGYVYNMSKRTAVYGTLAYLKNKNNSNLALNAKGVLTAADVPGAGNSQTGVQLGIRHAF